MSDRTRAVIGEYEAAVVDPFVDAYYDHSGFYNFGYWQEGTRTQKQACENLVDRLPAPDARASRSGDQRVQIRPPASPIRRAPPRPEKLRAGFRDEGLTERLNG